MTTLYGRAFVERAQVKDGEPIPFVAATEGMKADGIDLRMDRIILSRFEANPLIGYGHDYWGRDGLPIGRSVDTAVDGTLLRMKVDFDQGDEFATTVERKIRGGYLNAMSIGFDVGRVDANGVPDWWELYESSIVPLPMDPDATAERIARQLGALREGKVLSKANMTKVQAAIDALQALLEAADPTDPDDPGRARTVPGDPGRDRTVPAVDVAEDLARRLRLAQARQPHRLGA